MREEQFRVRLRQRSLCDGARASAMSRCQRVERYEGNLDEHYRDDGLRRLSSRLVYRAEDETKGIPPRHRVFMAAGANIRNGTASLANAVRLYSEFSNAGGQHEDGLPLRANPRIQAPRMTGARGNMLVWPTWSTPGNCVLLEMAAMVAPFIHFLHPDIVNAVVCDNERNRVTWEARLQNLGINSASYLWEGSACAFPVVRRHAGGAEIAQHRGRMKAERRQDALTLDDNDYPKQIWSFIYRGKQFQKHGPVGYGLAHLADHKEHKNRCAEEFEGAQDGLRALPGLYTSLTNAAYMPTALIRPTDFSFRLRNLMQRRALALYGNFCRLLPEGLGIKENVAELWSLDQFKWAEPVGAMERVPAFLEWRRVEMEKLFQNAESQSAIPATA